MRHRANGIGAVNDMNGSTDDTNMNNTAMSISFPIYFSNVIFVLLVVEYSLATVPRRTAIAPKRPRRRHSGVHGGSQPFPSPRCVDGATNVVARGKAEVVPSSRRPLDLV